MLVRLVGVFLLKMIDHKTSRNMHLACALLSEQLSKKLRSLDSIYWIRSEQVMVVDNNHELMPSRHVVKASGDAL